MGEEGGQASIYSSRTRGPVRTPTTLCWLVPLAAMLSAQRKEVERQVAGSSKLSILATCCPSLLHRTYMWTLADLGKSTQAARR